MTRHPSTLRTIVVASCCSLALGCAAQMEQTGNEALLPEIDVVQVKEHSDEALKLAQEAKLDVDVLNTKLTEIDNKLVLLSEEISGVSIAKIEEMENRMTLLIEAYKDLQAQVSSIQVLPQVQVKKGPAATFSPAASASILQPSSEYESYQNALRTFNNRKYDEALKLLNECLSTFPNGAYADNCTYWIGECHYAMSDFAAAIAAFQKVLAFARSSKADDAQLKIGLSYMKLGQYGQAKTELKTLIDRYPASEYAPRAQKYLADMK